MIPDRDSRLAELIDRLADEQWAGRVADVDGLAKAHPDLAVELRDLWAVAQFAHLARQPDFSKRPTITFSRGPLTPNHTHDRTASDNGPLLPREFGDFEILEELGR